MSDLSQERLQRLLTDAPLGQPLRYFDVTDSTNTEGLEWARRNAPHGALVVADVQRKGRGRLGRTWEGGAGKSILASFVLREGLNPERMGLIGGAAAVAVVSAVQRMTSLPAQTKWPNDVWVGEKKLAGILIEAVWTGERLESLVVGIGLNVNQGADELPRDARTLPTSLRAKTGREWDRSLLLRLLIDEFARTLLAARTNPQAFLEEWKRGELTLNREVEAMEGDRCLQGTVRDLLPDGSLLLEGEDGVERQLKWGELSVRPRSVLTSS